MDRGAVPVRRHGLWPQSAARAAQRVQRIGRRDLDRRRARGRRKSNHVELGRLDGDGRVRLRWDRCRSAGCGRRWPRRQRRSGYRRRARLRYRIVPSGRHSPSLCQSVPRERVCSTGNRPPGDGPARASGGAMGLRRPAIRALFIGSCACMAAVGCGLNPRPEDPGLVADRGKDAGAVYGQGGASNGGTSSGATTGAGGLPLPGGDAAVNGGGAPGADSGPGDGAVRDAAGQ